jgi:TonB family protein
MSSNLMRSKFLPLLRRPVDPLAHSDYLGQRYFLMTVGAAVLLHIAGVAVWSMMPRAEVMDIPVNVLNIKLGDSDAGGDEAVQPPSTGNSLSVESVLSQMADVQDTQRTRRKAAVSSIDKAMAGKESAPRALDKAMAGNDAMQEAARNIARQFVRTSNAPLANPGSELGNSDAKNAEMISRYEQLISAWIQKFKQYPEDARAKGMQGETMVRIRIDRQGTIRYYALEYSTGSELLDHAAIDMIKRANPVPAVPADYPKDDLIEFLIPVSFKLQ